jgi:hypothetical protein
VAAVKTLYNTIKNESENDESLLRHTQLPRNFGDIESLLRIVWYGNECIDASGLLGPMTTTSRHLDIPVRRMLSSFQKNPARPYE